jgi:CubicO group peptidase (beta-lactamase class C family)
VTVGRGDLGRTVERASERAGVQGVAVALVERGEVAWSEGFGGCRGDGRGRIGAETVFAVASLSKPPFAHLVVRLADRGLLDLDTPLAELYPEPYDAYGLDQQAPEPKQITARHVLSHTSGLGNWEDEDIGRIGFAPGSRWHYSGEGYVYLQAVVEHLTGSPLEQVAAAEVFRPLGMRSTGYLWERASPGADACSFEGREFTRASAAFSLHTTAADYARFVVDTLESAVGGMLLAPQVEIDDSLGWGLGWGLAGDVVSRDIVWHWGEMDHFTCAAVASRAQRRGLVCLTNGDEGVAACAEILAETLGEEFAYPIRAVLERGW